MPLSLMFTHHCQKLMCIFNEPTTLKRAAVDRKKTSFPERGGAKAKEKEQVRAGGQQKKKKPSTPFGSQSIHCSPFNFFWAHNPFSFNSKFNSPQGPRTRLVNTKPDN